MVTDDSTKEGIIKRGDSSLDLVQIISAAGPLIGLGAVRRLEKDLSRGELIKPYTSLIVRLARLLPISMVPQTYYSKVLAVVFILSDLRGKKLNEDEFAYHLGVLSDYCLGVPADDEVVGFFKTTFEQHMYIWTRLNCAQCVGYLWGGLRHAHPMFIDLMQESSTLIHTQTTRLLSRVVYNQRMLIDGFRSELRTVEEECSQNSEEIEVFKHELSDLAQLAPIQSVVQAAESLSDEEILIDKQRRDEEFLIAHKDAFLQNHREEFVAIRNGDVIGFARKATDIERIVRERVGDNARVLVEKITPEAFERHRPEKIFMG